MIVTKDFIGKEFESKESLHKALRENKKSLKSTKIISVKNADAVYNKLQSSKSIANKANQSIEDIKEITVKFVVNSCGWYDSHGDVHLKGCWNQTVKNNPRFIHLQEHKAIFDNVISYNSTPSVEEIEIQGNKVEALVATSVIEKEVNKSMFDRYAKGQIKEHSVGMRYIWDKLYLCIDSNHEDDKEEKANYDKYIDQVINKEDVEATGYFWAVGEAKALEGSAVVFGSNSQTPVLNIEETKEFEPLENTQTNEPSNDTQKNNIHLFI